MRKPVRCRTCHWTGQRATDLSDGEAHPKPCPKGHEVTVGGWPPSVVETTPNGVLIEFWDETNIETGEAQQRRYRINGEKVPSATTILGVLNKPALLDWAARLAREGRDWRDVRDEAAERGTDSHTLACGLLAGDRVGLQDLKDEHRAYGQAAMRWISRRRPQVEQLERMVASTEHGYSGRLDLLGRVSEGLGLWDYKSVTKWAHNDKGDVLPPYDENALQLDLYSGALVESGYPAPDFGGVVRLGPDGEYEETLFELDPSRGLAILGAYQAKADAGRALRAGLIREAVAA
jgi:hypothetical protein